MRRFLALSLLLAACSTAAPAATTITTGSSTTASPLPAPSTSTSTTTTTLPPTTTVPASTTSTVDTATVLYERYVTTDEYLPGLAVEIHAPAETGAWPVIVTVHGGGWYGGTLDSMGFLADGLAQRGAVVFNVTYRRAAQGGLFPGPVDDVACAIAYAASKAGDYGSSADVVVVVGHSAGAHMAALVTMAPGLFGSDCPFEPPDIDGFVGLAGPYNTGLLAFLLEPWFGVAPGDDPDLWARGNPLTHVDSAPDISYLLVHGDADELIPVSFTEELHDALATARRDVDFVVVPDAGHGEVNDPRVVGDLIADFVSGLQ